MPTIIKQVDKVQEEMRTGAAARRREAPAPSAAGRDRPPLYNRVRTLMVHAPRYSFQGQARLAADVGCARSTVSRMVNGKTRPSYRLAQAVVAALGRQLRRPLDPADVFSPTGGYPTPSGCEAAGCKGCLPDEAYDAEGDMRPEWRGQRPGEWSLARPAGET